MLQETTFSTPKCASLTLPLAHTSISAHAIHHCERHWSVLRFRAVTPKMVRRMEKKLEGNEGRKVVGHKFPYHQLEWRGGWFLRQLFGALRIVSLSSSGEHKPVHVDEVFISFCTDRSMGAMKNV